MRRSEDLFEQGILPHPCEFVLYNECRSGKSLTFWVKSIKIVNSGTKSVN